LLHIEFSLPVVWTDLVWYQIVPDQVFILCVHPRPEFGNTFRMK